MDCLSNPFTTNKGTLSKKISSLDEIDNKGTVYTCRSLNYSSSSPRNSGIITILDITITTAPTTDIDHTALKEVQLEEGRIIGRLGIAETRDYIMEVCV